VREGCLPLVAGSVGPYGACQHDGSEYTGSYVDHMTKQELQAWHGPRVGRLVASGVDLLACETLPSLPEAQALARLLGSQFPATPAWLSFSCRVRPIPTTPFLSCLIPMAAPMTPFTSWPIPFL
jgi:homocysteine S-methyltransferase